MIPNKYLFNLIPMVKYLSSPIIIITADAALYCILSSGPHEVRIVVVLSFFEY